METMSITTFELVLLDSLTNNFAEMKVELRMVLPALVVPLVKCPQ